MSLSETTGDLFTQSSRTSALAHCVSQCFKMGKGIALLFRQKFGGVDELLKQKVSIGGIGVLQREGRVIYYLVTKQHFYDKPTYDTIQSSIRAMKKHAVENKVQEISLPRIGCGLDRHKWPIVSTYLMKEFYGTGIKLNVFLSDIEPFAKSAPIPIPLPKGQKTISFVMDLKTTEPGICVACLHSMEHQECGCYKCLNEQCRPSSGRCFLAQCCHLHHIAPQCEVD